MTFSDAEDIRKRYDRGGITMLTLAEEYGVTKAAIRWIVEEIIWKKEWQ